MKSRIIWAAIVVAAIVGFYVVTIRPAMIPTAPRINTRLLKELRPPEIFLPALPAPSMPMPTLSPPALPLVTLPLAGRPELRRPMTLEVPVQDAASVDLSIGVPVLRPQREQQEALDRAVREVVEATRDVTFEPKK